MTRITAYAGLTANQGGSGSVLWINAFAAEDAPDNFYAAQNTTGIPANDSLLVATQFGFTAPSGILVSQVTVTYWTYNNENLQGGTPGICQLTLDGTTLAGNNNFNDNFYVNDTGPFTPEGTQVFGSASGSWGLTLSDVEINATTFGVILQASSQVQNFVDAIQIDIDYDFVTPTPTPTLTFSPTPTTSPTVTPTPTMVVSPTITLTPTTTVTPTMTAPVTPTVTLTPSATVTLTPSATVSPTITPTVTPTLTVSPTITPTVTTTRTPTPTMTVTPTITPTIGGGTVNDIPKWFMQFFHNKAGKV